MVIDYKLLAELAENYEYQYQVEALYGKLIAKELDKEFDVYVSYDENSKYFSCDAVNFKIAMRDVKDYNDLYNMLKDKLSENNTDAKLKNKFHYFFEEVGIESKVGEMKDYSRYSGFNSMGFFDLLWYLKTGEMKRDGSIGRELMDVAQNYADKYPNDEQTYFYPRHGLQYQIRYGSWIDLTTVDPKFSGWQVKFFQNKKIQIKGMSDEYWDKIVHLDEICSK